MSADPAVLLSLALEKLDFSPEGARDRARFLATRKSAQSAVTAYRHGEITQQHFTELVEFIDVILSPHTVTAAEHTTGFFMSAHHRDDDPLIIVPSSHSSPTWRFP